MREAKRADDYKSSLIGTKAQISPDRDQLGTYDPRINENNFHLITTTPLLTTEREFYLACAKQSGTPWHSCDKISLPKSIVTTGNQIFEICNKYKSTMFILDCWQLTTRPSHHTEFVTGRLGDFYLKSARSWYWRCQWVMLLFGAAGKEVEVVAVNSRLVL